MPSFGQTRRASMACDQLARGRSGQSLAPEPGQEVVQVIRARISDYELARTFFPRPYLDRSPDLLGQFLLEARHVAVRAHPAPGFGRRMEDGVDQILRLPNGKRPGRDAFR